MFSPSVCAYSIASKVTCELCPFKINKCLLVRGMRLEIDLVKNDKNSLKKKDVIHVFFALSCMSLAYNVLCNHLLSSHL